MFGRKKKQQKKEEHRQAVRKGLLFWLPGGSSRIDVYLDYCVVRCLGKTKLPEKERVIPFTDVKDVIYTPATPSRMASLQLITKQMPEVKRSYWYAYENNLIVRRGAPGVSQPPLEGGKAAPPRRGRGQRKGRAGREGEGQGRKSRSRASRTEPRNGNRRTQRKGS